MNKKLGLAAVGTGLTLGFLVPTHPFVHTDATTQPKTVVVHFEEAPPKITDGDPFDATWPGASEDETLHCFRATRYPNAGWLDEFPKAVVLIVDHGTLTLDDVPGEQAGQTVYGTCQDAI